MIEFDKYICFLNNVYEARLYYRDTLVVTKTCTPYEIHDNLIEEFHYSLN